MVGDSPTMGSAGAENPSSHIVPQQSVAARQTKPTPEVGHQLTLEDAIAAGERGMAQAEDAAAREHPMFSERAAAAIVAFLLRQPERRANGEDISAAVCTELKCKAQALGSAYQRLQRMNTIRCTRIDVKRRHGHGSVGGKEWELVEARR